MVLVGLESLSLDNLKGVDRFKASMLENYREYVRRIQDHGMIVLAAFIVGFDHDDASVFERIEDFVLDNRSHAADNDRDAAPADRDDRPPAGSRPASGRGPTGTGAPTTTPSTNRRG